MKTGLTTLDIAEVSSWFPLSEICAVFCVFLSLSSFYFPLIFKPDMIGNSFRSVFLNSLLEKALRTAYAVKDLQRNTCRGVGYVGYGAKRKFVMYSIVLNLNGILRRIGKNY